MEKLIYPVWKPEALDGDAFRQRLIVHLASELQPLNPVHLTVCVVDADVSEAADYRIEHRPPAADGLVILWLHSAGDRAPIEVALGRHVSRFEGYLVTESEPLRNTTYPTAKGQRTPGMNQVVFLRQPARLQRREWLHRWLNDHTSVAIETQSTFAYRQNLVARVLTDSAEACDAIVEENFPPAALASRAAFYDAPDDERLYRQREKTMVDSCARFIDFDEITCIPMSDYELW